jgi:anti-sigma B factor antagonist
VLEIATTDEPPGLRLDGEVDLASAEELSSALEPHVRRGGDVTLDVARVRFMGSSGILVLVRALNSLEGRGRLVLLDPPEGIRRLIEITGLDRVEHLDVRNGT